MLECTIVLFHRKKAKKKYQKAKENMVIFLFVIIALEYVCTQSTQGKLAREYLRLRSTWAREHARHSSTWARKHARHWHVSPEARKLRWHVREHLSTQDTLAPGHLSTLDTLAQERKARNLANPVSNSVVLLLNSLWQVR